MYLALFYTHSSPAVSYWLCISVRFPSLLLRWDINRHNWRNENLIIKDSGFVHIYTSAASTSCQVVSFILKSFPTPLCSPHRIRVLFPSFPVCRFLPAVIPLSLSPIRKWPVRALREKRKSVEDRIPHSEEGSNPHQHVCQCLKPLLLALSLPPFFCIHIKYLSFSPRLMNGWKESKVWPLWRTRWDVFRDVRPTFCTFMKFQQFNLVQCRTKVNKSQFELSLHFTIVQYEL